MEPALLAASVLVSLVCEGTGTRRNIYANQPYNDTIRVELREDGGRIQVPAAMLPPELRGGEDGWYELRDFSRSDIAYRARVRVNFINSAKVEIDRVSGALRIDGGQSGFTGMCRAVEGREPLF